MLERVVREIRMLRAMRRALEKGLRKLLTGHEDGNVGHRLGISYGLPPSVLYASKRSNSNRSMLFPFSPDLIRSL